MPSPQIFLVIFPFQNLLLCLVTWIPLSVNYPLNQLSDLIEKKAECLFLYWFIKQCLLRKSSSNLLLFHSFTYWKVWVTKGMTPRWTVCSSDNWLFIFTLRPVCRTQLPSSHRQVGNSCLTKRFTYTTQYVAMLMNQIWTYLHMANPSSSITIAIEPKTKQKKNRTSVV